MLAAAWACATWSVRRPRGQAMLQGELNLRCGCIRLWRSRQGRRRCDFNSGGDRAGWCAAVLAGGDIFPARHHLALPALLISQRMVEFVVAPADGKVEQYGFGSA